MRISQIQLSKIIQEAFGETRRNTEIVWDGWWATVQKNLQNEPGWDSKKYRDSAWKCYSDGYYEDEFEEEWLASMGLLGEAYGGKSSDMSYEEKQALYKIIDIIKNNIISKMMRDEEDRKEHFSGSSLVYVNSLTWLNIRNKPIVIRKTLSYLKDNGLSGKWIDQNNILVKW